jgi:hypothetical protein
MERIGDMTIAQLVERFTAVALDQCEAQQRYSIPKVNRLFDQMEALEGELKKREGDQRRALLPLYDHPVLHVRLKAALATLAVAPKETRFLLEEIGAKNKNLQGLDANMTLRQLNNGEFKPT